MSETDDPKMDFRYKMGDTQIEGYQITPATRWQQEKWPAWLVMQRLPDETNALYSAGDGSDNLILALPSGDVVLPPLAWVTKAVDGALSIVEAMDMEAWVKVVPVPEPVVAPPADAIADAAPVVALRPVPTLENVAGDTTEMRAEMTEAIKILQEADTETAGALALDYLKGCMVKRTIWCNCVPGQCAFADQSFDDESVGIDVTNCRQHSPLVAG